MQQWPLQCDRASQDDNGDGAGRVTRRRSKPTQDTLAALLMVPEHVNKGTVPPVHVSLILSSPSLDRAPLFRRPTRVTCLCELSWTPRAVEAAHARLATIYHDTMTAAPQPGCRA